MKLSTRAMATACSLFTGGMILLCGVAHLIWPGYAGVFLDLMASVYPGFDGGSSVWQVLVGTIYGLLDGLVGGGIFAWLYNQLRPDRPAGHAT